MRSVTGSTITDREVATWALQWLLSTGLVRDVGPRCTALTVWSLLLRAAARLSSLAAACRDLCGAPSSQAVAHALAWSLPRDVATLEARLHHALTGHWPRWLRRRRWDLAIDYHLVPYYGQPLRHAAELTGGKPRQGTKIFHTYATACVVVAGYRWTVALTWVRRHETAATVLTRLWAQLDTLPLRVRCVLLDRAFFHVAVVDFLQQQNLPFLIPTMFRGRRPQPGRPPTGLRALAQQPPGWYSHTLKNKTHQVDVAVAVWHRPHRHRRDGQSRVQILMIAGWRVAGTPQQVAERYRQRFGIETSYRQLRQARIYTCTRDPLLRLVYVAVALVLRNVWVWIHQTRLSEATRWGRVMHLERLRFKRMLHWIAAWVERQLHDGSPPYVE